MRSRSPGNGRANSQRGFTLFELVVMVVVVAFLATVFLKRFLVYQELAEKANMEQTAGAIKAGLTIQMAALLARGRSDEIPRLAAVNPIKILNELPENYVGEFFKPNPGDIRDGSWYFDLKNKHLVYVPKRSDHFEADAEGKKEARFRIKLVKNDLLDIHGKDEASGVTLEKARPYVWNIQ